MKSFIDFIREEGEGGGGMVSAVPANAVGTGAYAGLNGDPPVGKKRKKPVMTSSPLKRLAPIKM